MTTTALVSSANKSLSNPRLDRHAERIRGLMKDMASNGLALGRELAASRKYFEELEKKARPAASWKEWASEQFHISGDWAVRLIRISKNSTRATQHLAAEVIETITATPSSEAQGRAIAEIRERISGGEKVSRRGARAIVRKHKLGGNGAAMPSPSEAKRIAAQHHIIVAASDGRLYTGASDQAVKEAEDKRTVVYGVRRALEMLANVSMTAKEFLKYADPHQLWTKDEEWAIAGAVVFVNALSHAWDERGASV